MIMDYFPDWKNASVSIYHFTNAYVNSEPVQTKVVDYSGMGWFWTGSQSEIYRNDQTKDIPSHQLVIARDDATLTTTQAYFAEVDGVDGYRLSEPFNQLGLAEMYFFNVYTNRGV